MAVRFIKNDDTYEQGHCPVSVVELQGFSPEKIINTISYEDDIYENSSNYHQTVKLSPTFINDDETNAISGFSLQYYESNEDYSNDYLVTDRVNDKNNPLYYVYELKFDAYSIVESDILQVYKNNEIKVPKKEYEIEYGNVTLSDNYYGSQDTDFDRYASGVTWGGYDTTITSHRVRLLLPIEFHNPDDFYTVRYTKSLYNVTSPTHNELIEIQPLYSQSTDFQVINNFIEYRVNSKLPRLSVDPLYVIKDPDTQLKSVGIFSVDGENYQNDSDTSWNTRINTGSFVSNADYAGSYNSFFEIDFIVNDPSYDGRYQVMSYVKPKILGGNVVKVQEKPIYIDPSGYVYPNYTVDVFPRTTDSTLIPSGTIGVDIDGVNVTDLKVSSIDRNKGYMLFNKQISSDQDMNLFFYIDTSKEMYIRNLELNPRLSGLYGFSAGSSELAFTNIGIALKKHPIGGLPLNDIDKREYLWPYFFDFDNIGTFYRASPVPVSTPATTEVGTLIWNPYSTTMDPTADFMPIAHLSVNRLTPDILKVQDARVIGGGLNKDARKKLKNDQLNSYTDVGYYDGEPLPYAGIVVIHIPRSKYDALVSQWESSNLFNPDLYTDMSEEEIEQLEFYSSGVYKEYYNKLLQGLSPTNDPYKDPYSTMLRQWARREAGHYLDQLIKKYISAGTQYILLDENFNQIELEL